MYIDKNLAWCEVFIDSRSFNNMKMPIIISVCTLLGVSTAVFLMIPDDEASAPIIKESKKAPNGPVTFENVHINPSVK